MQSSHALRTGRQESLADQPTSMTAIVCDVYGAPEVLMLEDIARPVVKDNDVLVRVRAASVNVADWLILRGPPYVARPDTEGCSVQKTDSSGRMSRGRWLRPAGTWSGSNLEMRCSGFAKVPSRNTSLRKKTTSFENRPGLRSNRLPRCH